MSQNRLYNLIENRKDQISTTLNVSRKLHHTQMSHYFYFELPLKNHVCLEPYTLTSHHISVYEKPSSMLDAKSQYHYTAYFSDTDGLEYRLHVYFDSQDNKVSRPLFSIINNEDDMSSVNCLEYEEAFMALAESSIQFCISHLRNEQKIVTEQLQREYDELEKNADCLYQNLPKNKKNYMLAIEGLISKIDELLVFIENSRSIKGKKAFLRSLKQAIETLAEKESSVIKPEKTKKQANQKNIIPMKSSIKTTASKPGKPSFAELFDHLKKQYGFNLEISQIDTQLRKLTDEKIASLYLGLIEFDLKIVFESLKPSVSDLNFLHTWKEKTEDAGKIRLKNHLFTRQFEQAKKFEFFYPLISPDEMASIALSLNMPVLLDWLLKNEILKTDHKNLTISKIHYRSMVDYCFRETRDKRSLLDCLNVLIQHGASLMEIDQTNNLPFAATLLMDEEHPLYNVLTKNAQASLRNPVFFKQLNKILDLQLIQFDSYEREEISRLIEANLMRINEIVAITSLLKNQSTLEIIDDVFQQCKDKFGKEFVNKLLSEPEIKAMSLKIQEKSIRLLEILGPEDRKHFDDSLKSNHIQLQESLNSLVSTMNPEERMDYFDVIKWNALENQYKIIAIIDLNMELLTVNTIIDSSAFIKNKSQVNEAKCRQKLLIQEISQLQNSLPMNQLMQHGVNQPELRFNSNEIMGVTERTQALTLNSPDLGFIIKEHRLNDQGKEIIVNTAQISQGNIQISAAALSNPMVRTLFSEIAQTLNPGNNDSQLIMKKKF